jgi:hypothetical protein
MCLMHHITLRFQVIHRLLSPHFILWIQSSRWSQRWHLSRANSELPSMDDLRPTGTSKIGRRNAELCLASNIYSDREGEREKRVVLHLFLFSYRQKWRHYFFSPPDRRITTMKATTPLFRIELTRPWWMEKKESRQQNGSKSFRNSPHKQHKRRRPKRARARKINFLVRKMRTVVTREEKQRVYSYEPIVTGSQADD